MQAKTVQEILNERYDEDPEFERKFAAHQRSLLKMEVVEDKPEDNWQLIKNPPSLQYFGISQYSHSSMYIIEGGRGIALANGDIYVETSSEVLHDNIVTILQDNNIIKPAHFPGNNNWWDDYVFNGIIPMEYTKNKVLQLFYYVGENLYVPNYKLTGINKQEKEFMRIFSNVQQKNPNLKIEMKIEPTYM